MKRSRFPGQYEPLSLTERPRDLQGARLQFELQQYVTEQFLARTEIESVDGTEWLRHSSRDEFVRRASTFIFGKKRTESVSYPRDWWQALKQRFAPAWFLRRYPVQFTTWTVDAFSLFPELGPARSHYLELSFCEPARLQREWDR